MAFNFQTFLKGIRIKNTTTPTLTEVGDISVDSANGKLQYHNGTTQSPIVTEAHSATLTNKTIDADGTGNSITNIDNDDIKTGANIDRAKLANGSNNHVIVNDGSGVMVSQAQLSVFRGGTGIDTSVSSGVAKVAAGTWSVSSIVDADVAVGAAIVDTKLATISTAGKVSNSATTATNANTASTIVSRDGSGNFSAGTITANVTGNVSGTAANITGVAALLNGGTGIAAVSANAAFNALSPVTTRGDLIVRNATVNARLPMGSPGQVLKVVGSDPVWSSFSGGVNYISGNPDAEGNSTTGWAAYADVAAATPVDGTGGAPITTITATATTPLRGTYSLLLTKPATNNRGEGVSYDFTIDSADKAKPLQISFDYTPSSSNFVAGNSSDLRVWIYDIDSAALIQPAPYTIQGGSGSNHRFIGTFQTSAASTNYRLIIHTAGAHSNAYTFKFDNVYVGPQSVTYGSPITDMGSLPNPSSSPTNATIIAYKAGRIGDCVNIQGSWSFSGASSFTGIAAAAIMPTGLTVDTTKIAIATSTGTDPFTVGTWYALDFGAADYTGVVAYNSVNNTFYLVNQTASTPFTPGASDTFAINIKVPVSGWSSTVTMSNDTDTRVVAARYTVDTGAQDVHTAGTIVRFDTKVFDTHAAVTTGASWKFTAPVSGIYRLSSNIFLNSGGSSDLSGFDPNLYVNGVSDQVLSNGVPSTGNSTTNGTFSASTLVELLAGEYIDIRPANSTGTLAVSATASRSWINIERLSGPASIAASEKIAVIYTSTSSAAVTANVTPITYGTKVLDTHNAFSGTTFTAPRNDTYIVSGTFYYSGASVGAIFKNGTRYAEGTLGAGSNPSLTYTVMRLNAGDTVDVRCQTSITVANNATNSIFTVTSQ